VADELRAAGAHVVRLARSCKTPRATASPTCKPTLTPPDVERVVRRLVDDLGVPNIVVNNGRDLLDQVARGDDAGGFHGTLATNLTGPFLLARALVPRMVERGSGHLVTIGFDFRLHRFPGSTAYARVSSGCAGCRGDSRRDREDGACAPR